MKNYLGQSVALAFLVLFLLGLLSALPAGMDLGGLKLRKMDIFADIRADRRVEPPPPPLPTIDTLAEEPEPDTLPAVVLPEPGDIPMPDSALFGVSFEDYSAAQNALAAFFAAVDSIKSHNRTVRVAFYGDSFIEGDILLGDLRDTLQSLWGGSGVGFVPVTSEVARFKRTLLHTYDHWETFSIVKNHDSGQPFGLNGFVYVAKPGARTHYEGLPYFRHTREWARTRLFYATETAVPFVYRVNGGAAEPDVLPATQGKIRVFEWKRPQTRSFELEFAAPDSLLAYGLTFESGPGLYIDNFSVRGNTGGRLRLISPALIRQFDAWQHYDLVVVQLGLNAVTEAGNNVEWYRQELRQTFAHLRAAFPGRPILVISVADRAGKTEDGALATMPSVPRIADMQRDLARRFGFLFYDLYRGLGGSGTMVRFANAKPALANKDYTHLTHAGGRFVGRQFARLFQETRLQYTNPKTGKNSK